MRHALLLPLLLLTVLPASAQPLLDKQDLFTSGQGGYATYRIPGLIVTAKGFLLAYCEARKNSASDWGHIDILLRRSTDGGKTWSEPKSIATVPPNTPRNPMAVAQGLAKPNEITLNNPLAIADRSGRVHFFYCVEYNRCLYMSSEDDGVNFTKPRDITPTFDAYRPEYDWRVLATGPGHGIQLKNGRLIVPVWLSLGTGGHAHRPSAITTIYSDDAGATWHRSAIIANDPNPRNPSENMAAELSDGRVMLNFRHEGPARYRGVTISPDGEKNWSEIRYDLALPEPVCMGSLLRVDGSDGKPRLLFTNPHNEKDRKRQNLTIKLSEDDGQTWGFSRTLESGLSAYSDLAAGRDGTIYCLYERGSGGENAKPYAYLTLARFNLEWVKGK